MRRRGVAASILCALISISPATAFATETSSPSPSTATSAHSLTQAQKVAISTAHAAFEAAKKNAFDGFERAIADAQAVRDQAISAAGADKSAVRAAKKNFRDSYRTIVNAYKTDLSTARSTLAKAIASIKGANKLH